jgi:FtsZ-binding cell division protein ZapB
MTEKVEVEEDKSNVRENIDVQKFLNVATEKYNEKYSTLSEEEKNIIKVLRNGDADSKKELLNNMIKETVSMVNDRLKSVGGNMELKEKLLETKDVIYNMSDFNGETFGEDIKKLYNIKSVFS